MQNLTQSPVQNGGSMAITLTLRRAAEESGLSVRTLNYAIARGALESVTVGRRRLIPVRALEAFLLRGGRMRNKPVEKKEIQNL